MGVYAAAGGKQGMAKRGSAVSEIAAQRSGAGTKTPLQAATRLQRRQQRFSCSDFYAVIFPMI
jgi:hypothetical protein